VIPKWGSWAAIKLELVSTISPRKSSVPTDINSAVTVAFMVLNFLSRISVEGYFNAFTLKMHLYGLS
jgi:hypothetical protein